MLKKLIKLLSINELFANKIGDSKNIAQPLTTENKLHQTAKDLKEAGDQSLNANNLNQAAVLYKKSLEINPNQPAAYNNLGITLYHLNQLKEALASYDNAIALKPDFAYPYNNRGLVLNDLKRFNEALASYDRAIALNPDYAEAYYNQGIVLNNLQRLDETLASYDRAIALNPDYVQVYNNRGIVLRDLKRRDEALASYDRAIALKPDFAVAHNNRGIVLNDLERFDEALASYDRAITLKPDYAEAYNNRGFLLHDLKRPKQALASFDRAITLKPDYEFLYGHWLDTKMQLCDWNNYDNHVMQLAEKIKRHEKASSPFETLSQLDSRVLQKISAEIFVQSKYPADHALPKIPKRTMHDKIRIAYFSADFRNHPLSFLMAELFEIHDRSRFELTAFSFGPGTEDEMRSRVTAAFDQFIDVREHSDQEVALMARNLEIDIAIDLGGFTIGCRTDIFALRAAPIQVSYLGYLGTMGAEYIDYLIADATIIPQQHRQDYKEKIVYLPSYQVNDTKRIIADKVFTREELGLPPTGFVFCCFNNSYKINPNTFDSWMRILRQVKGSVLWLLGENESVITNLRAEATLRGIDARRLVFAQRVPLAEYLARYRIADLFLDTLPYNAGTTASDALWVGLPVLTHMGNTFAGRVAASLLNAIHLPELITTTQEEYETLAITLATQAEKLMQIKQKLAANRLTTPLFDTQQFRQHIENAYVQMYERYQADLMPEHIDVKKHC